VPPIYLTLEDALELFAAIVSGTPTQANDQLRNRGGLQSALERPSAYAHYEGADLAMQAAVLAHGIAEAQTFVDGNKRLALVAMLTFLEVNGFRVETPDVELAAWIVELAGAKDPAALAERLRDVMRPVH
jgi:death on curing protein